MEFMRDGIKHMQIKFYIEGAEPGLKGTVHSESKEVSVLLCAMQVHFIEWMQDNKAVLLMCSCTNI